MDTSDLSKIIDNPPIDSQIGAMMMISIRPDQSGYAGEVGVAYETMDRIVSEAKIIKEQLLTKRPASIFRTIQISDEEFRRPNPAVYDLPQPPYNEFSNVPPRSPDGSLTTPSVPKGAIGMSVPSGITDPFERYLYLAMPEFERMAFHANKRWPRVACYLRKVFFSEEYKKDPVATLQKEVDRHSILSAEWMVTFGQFPGDPMSLATNTYAARMKQSLLVEFPPLEESARTISEFGDAMLAATAVGMFHNFREELCEMA